MSFKFSENPRVFQTRVTEITRWLENNYYKKDRDWSYSLQGPFALFEFTTFRVEQAFHRQFTRYYR